MRTERQNSMRVLMVSSERTWGGGEAQLELLMKGLLADGLRVHLAAPANSEIRRRVSELNAPFHPVAIENGFDLVSAWRLRSVVKRGRFGVVHSHTSHAHSTSFMACTTVPKSQRPFQVVSRRVAAPVATHWLSRAKYQKGADVFLAVSNCVRDVLADGGVPQNKIRLVHDGIDLSKFDRVRENAYVKAEFGIDAGAPVVGNVAALAPYKSQVDIIRAAPIVRDRYPRVKFLIVGEGKLREHLQSLIDEMGLAGTVVLTGFRDDPLEIMSTFA
ncbi:MAG: glycosyltransferase, partial [Candidatus Krumholzibacteria bacterium]|nr:glycosyltransferase [Candidatus Krumholzibacteria bacterium]